MGRDTRLRRSLWAAGAAVTVLVSGLILGGCTKTVPDAIHLSTPRTGGGVTALTDTVTPPTPISVVPNPAPSEPARDPAIPASAWMDANSLPLNDSQHWPDLAGVAQPVVAGAFDVQARCQVAPPADQYDGAESASARVDRGAGKWSVQQQIVHYSGDPWTMGQVAFNVFETLVGTVQYCEATAPGARVTTTTPESHCESVARACSQLAVTIEIPAKQVVAHIYLTSAGSSVSELTMWSSPDVSPPWPAVGDAQIFAAMNQKLCTAWPC